MKNILFLLFSFSIVLVFAQNPTPPPVVKDSMSSDVFIDLIEETLNDYYAEVSKLPNYETILSDLELEVTDEISDEEICKRVEAMNELSAFKFDCNPIVLDAIRGFIKTRKSFVRIVMGRSTIYFDMYEEYLNKHNVPLNLKYLSVIESALKPQIKSRAGALGLWQFMYGTGKMYGLNSNAYYDERMDPLKSTDAAARYLKKLHEIYADWNVALAAYNAGPGNVNRAIRRAGGAVSYWKIRPFLPKETQQYVPRFIAATYLFTYAKQHQITAAPSPYTYYQLDTMCLKEGVYMKDIAELINWEIDSIKFFNPMYKGTYIPKTEPNQCITGPLKHIGKLVSLELNLYKSSQPEIIVADNSSNPSELYPLQTKTVLERYMVQPNEDLRTIANKFNVSLELLKQENKLTSEKLRVNQVIVVPRKVISSVKSSSEVQIIYDTVYFDTTFQIEHIVDRNENLDILAESYQVSKDSIMKWNDLEDKWINIGQKIIIHKTEKLFKINTKVIEVEQAPKPVVAPKPANTSGAQYYTVKSGDLFGRIAARYNLTQAQLQRLNPNVNPHRINIGQRLRIK